MGFQWFSSCFIISTCFGSRFQTIRTWPDLARWASTTGWVSWTRTRSWRWHLWSVDWPRRQPWRRLVDRWWSLYRHEIWGCYTQTSCFDIIGNHSYNERSIIMWYSRFDMCLRTVWCWVWTAKFETLPAQRGETRLWMVPQLVILARHSFSQGVFRLTCGGGCLRYSSLYVGLRVWQ